MFFVLACLLLAKHYGTNAAPVSPTFADPLPYDGQIFRRDGCSNVCSCPGRTVWDIFWSCLATTFTVTWVSVHPNVPWLEESSWTLTKRRIFLMCLALLAPEVMIMWAFKQWRGAVLIREAINQARPESSVQWTMTHAHFLQMGGFRLNYIEGGSFFGGDDYRYETKKGGIVTQEMVLTSIKLKQLLSEQLVDFPKTTAKEIEDRSKGDALSKGVTLLQITWFIVQLIARAHQHLTITEIELTTAALAGLNSITYLFWWSKPLDVRCPIIIKTKELERAEGMVLEYRYGEEVAGPVRPTAETWTFTEDEFRLRTFLRISLARVAQVTILRLATHLLHAVSVLFHLVRRRKMRVNGPEITLRSSTDSSSTGGSSVAKSQFRRAITSIWTTGKLVITKLVYLSYLLILLPIETMFRSGWPDLRGYSDAKDKMHRKPALHILFDMEDMRWIMWMMFHSEPAETTLLLGFSALVGAAFGSIHCAAWHFDFPSPVERILWQTAALSIVGMCLCIAGGIPIYNFLTEKARKAPQKAKVHLFLKIFLYLETAPVTLFLTIIYPLSRLSLLILALISLHNLPDLAFETVTWTEFISHI